MRQGSHQLVRWLFEEWERQRIEEAAKKPPSINGVQPVMGSVSATVLTEKAGISRNMIWLWRKGTCPKLDTFDAALGVFGYQLTIEKIKKD